MRMPAALALAALLLTGSAAAAQDAPAPAAPPSEAIDPVPPRAPLPPEPPPKVRKEIEALLKEYFEADPFQPPKGKNTGDMKAARQAAYGKLVLAVAAWNKGLQGNNALRMAEWWKARLFDTLPRVNQPAGKIFMGKDYEITLGKLKVPFALSVPANYRGKADPVYPVVLVALEKGMDPKEVLPAAYGDLLSTHIVLAVHEDRIQTAKFLLIPLMYLYDTYRIDRNRITLDGLGKAAHLVEVLAPSSPVYFDGAVFRAPGTVSELESNLAMFPCAAVAPAAPSEAATAALEALRAACGRNLTEVPEGPDANRAIQAWIAGLAPRPIADQKVPYSWTTPSVNRGLIFGDGYWFDIEGNDLAAEHSPGSISISRDPEHNLVDLECANVTAATLYLNDEVLDLDHPVVVRVNGIVVGRFRVERDLKWTFDIQVGRVSQPVGFRTFFITAALPFNIPPEARLTKAQRDALEEAKERAQDPPPPSPGEEPPQEPGARHVPPENPESTKPTVPAVRWHADLAAARDAAGKSPGGAAFVLVAGAESPDQAALEERLHPGGQPASAKVAGRLSKFECVRLATVLETPAAVPVVEEVARVEAKDAPLLVVLRPDGSLAERIPAAGKDEKPEEAGARVAAALDGVIAALGLPKVEPKPEDPPPAPLASLREALATGKPVIVRVADPAAPAAAPLPADALSRFLPFAVVDLPATAEAPAVLARTRTETVTGKQVPALLALRKDGTLAGRLDLAGTLPEEVAAKVKEWLAAMLAAQGLQAPEKAPEKAPEWKSMADAEGQPRIVLCPGEAGDPVQAALQPVLDSDEAKGALSMATGVYLPVVVRTAVAITEGASVEARDAPALYALRADGTILGSISGAALRPGDSEEGLLEWLADMAGKAAEPAAAGGGDGPPAAPATPPAAPPEAPPEAPKDAAPPAPPGGGGK